MFYFLTMEHNFGRNKISKGSNFCFLMSCDSKFVDLVLIYFDHNVSKRNVDEWKWSVLVRFNVIVTIIILQISTLNKYSSNKSNFKIHKNEFEW